MGYAKEFNFNDYAVPAMLLGKGWSDTSWHNDICPSFENYDLKLRVFVAEIKADDREYEELAQYSVTELIQLGKDEYICDEGNIFETESVEELETYLLFYDLYVRVNNLIRYLNYLEEPNPEMQDLLVDMSCTLKTKLNIQ